MQSAGRLGREIARSPTGGLSSRMRNTVPTSCGPAHQGPAQQTTGSAGAAPSCREYRRRPQSRLAERRAKRVIQCNTTEGKANFLKGRRNTNHVGSSLAMVLVGELSLRVAIAGLEVRGNGTLDCFRCHFAWLYILFFFLVGVL